MSDLAVAIGRAERIGFSITGARVGCSPPLSAAAVPSPRRPPPIPISEAHHIHRNVAFGDRAVAELARLVATPALDAASAHNGAGVLGAVGRNRDDSTRKAMDVDGRAPT